MTLHNFKVEKDNIMMMTMKALKLLKIMTLHNSRVEKENIMMMTMKALRLLRINIHQCIKVERDTIENLKLSHKVLVVGHKPLVISHIVLKKDIDIDQKYHQKDNT